jgi:hypothetical protein
MIFSSSLKDNYCALGRYSRILWIFGTWVLFDFPNKLLFVDALADQPTTSPAFQVEWEGQGTK